MATESRPLPELAKTAAEYARREYAHALLALSVQTVAALGFSESDNWMVDWRVGVMTREIPDPPATAEPSNEA